ncbi:TraR/DksA C4-type zinc finger protein [Duganella sp. LX20W]|uniref:TraR/DksA C4-type zinc finger protein n=1 Tax=Rugamonas brunnea TaxID=2758569 RepID=A0A7W2EP38_9BURK|nr:TraR/DksA C4-type zinc finger protein [Rugamonas brunnea]MBA5636022.1 TraR/DksA C4-type zinc finger protein [Rugamonas brunnea]
MNGLEQEQCKALQARLEQARLDLLSQLADDLDPGTDVLAPAVLEVEASPADNASNRTLNELVHETAEHTARHLQVVRHALAKFDDGSYGLCETCGEPIGYSRLNARPEARLCIACQTREEKPHR